MQLERPGLWLETASVQTSDWSDGLVQPACCYMIIIPFLPFKLWFGLIINACNPQMQFCSGEYLGWGFRCGKLICTCTSGCPVGTE